MAGMAVKLVEQYLSSQDVNVKEIRDDLIVTGWSFDGGSIQVYFAFDEDDEHVHLEGLGFLKTPKEKFDAMYRVLNECNNRFTHVKFVLDTEDGEIMARDDDVIQLDSCGPECYELMIRMVGVVEEAYKSFMKAIWA